MITKNKELAEKYFPDEYELVDTPYFGYSIHIGKRSSGWKPLFQVHDNAYTSVKSMKKFINSHKEDIRIFDEYDKEFTLEQLQDELIDWSKHQKVRYFKVVPEGVPDELFGGKNYLTESSPDDYDITSPFDHMEYEKVYSSIHKRSWGDIYKKDKDGYNFMEGWFM